MTRDELIGTVVLKTEMAAGERHTVSHSRESLERHAVNRGPCFDGWGVRYQMGGIRYR